MAISVNIQRHCVASDPETGLSPLQQQLLDDPHPIRIASAPTGAGKSYAFLKAMLQGEQRILFIVPTKRLAQNLASSLLNDLQQAGWSEKKAYAKVCIWSADQSSMLKKKGISNINAQRIREVDDLNMATLGGEMIISMPECLSNLLIRRGLNQGQAGFSVLDIVHNRFNHIVFDEFHSIEARGFGLAALLAKMVTLETSNSKLSFLSATPINIRPTLEKLDIETKHIKELVEELTSEGRAVHGDVQLHWSDASLTVQLEQNISAVIQEISAGRQIVMIYNSLADLKQAQYGIAEVLKQHGIDMAQCLCINSIDDTDQQGFTASGFRCGRQYNPLDFQFLLATSSVEMGVTFKANLMFMETGFSPLNFLQRYGRAARGEQQGQVWVSCQQDNAGWQRQLATWIEKNNQQNCNIEELSNILSQSVQKDFKKAIKDRHFGELPNRAYWHTGLYWQAMLKHKSSKNHMRKLYLAHQPKSSRMIHHWLTQVKLAQHDPIIGDIVKDWCQRFEEEAFTLRDIGQRLRIVEDDGFVRHAPSLWLQRNTDILNRCTPREDEQGQMSYYISGMLDDYLLDPEQKKFSPDNIEACFPHSQEIIAIGKGPDMISKWCAEFRSARNVWQDHSESMEAAEKLVKLTGIIVSSEPDMLFETSCYTL